MECILVWAFLMTRRLCNLPTISNLSKVFLCVSFKQRDKKTTLLFGQWLFCLKIFKKEKKKYEALATGFHYANRMEMAFKGMALFQL